MAGTGSKPGERRGGRQKGTPNKRTELAALWEETGCDPIRMMIEIVQGKAKQTVMTVKAGKAIKVEIPYTGDQVIQCLKELAQYKQPKLKAVEFSGPDGEPLAPQTIRVIFGNEGEDDG